MQTRSRTGSTLSLVVTATLVISLLGVSFFFLSAQMGGSRELQNATDAGGLNVAKQAIRYPGVGLSQNEEELNFGGLLDKRGGDVSLANYNRVVGQTLLVALNAQAEDTEGARAHARRLVDILEGEGGIGDRLRNTLSDPRTAETHFQTVAQRNSVRMLGGDLLTGAVNDSYQVGYMEEGSSANVDIDPGTMPYAVKGEGVERVSLPSGATTAEQSKRKNSFLSGYSPINIPGINRGITAVPVMPGKAPHLVSLTHFSRHTGAPEGAGKVPPNCFRTAGAAKTSRGAACSIVGALGVDFTAAIPRGVLIIKNGPGGEFAGQLGGSDHIFARELHTGVWVGPSAGGKRAFTTNKNLYDQWLNYNKARLSGVTPLPPPPSSSGINGDPLSITAEGEVVRWEDFTLPPDPLAAEMLPAIQAAYPHANATIPFSSNQLTAVEHYKAGVMQAFGRVTRLHDPTDPAFKQFVSGLSEPTGMKAFDHSRAYPATSNPAFGRSGSLREFLTQCNASVVLDQMIQRLKQIKPEASEQELRSVLDTPAIGMGQTLYIYRGADNRLCLSGQSPPWSFDSNPDGKAQPVSSTYQILKLSVNTPMDAGAPVFPFGYSDTAQGVDSCTFTPSSGYRNLLGVVNFSNKVSYSGGNGAAGGYFWDPN